MSVFRSAISSTGDVDPGYLALFWALIGWSVMITVIIGGLVHKGWNATPEQVVILLHEAGIAFGAVSVGFATVVGAVGVFRAGDREKR